MTNICHDLWWINIKCAKANENYCIVVEIVNNIDDKLRKPTESRN